MDDYGKGYFGEINGYRDDTAPRDLHGREDREGTAPPQSYRGEINGYRYDWTSGQYERTTPPVNPFDDRSYPVVQHTSGGQYSGARGGAYDAGSTEGGASRASYGSYGRYGSYGDNGSNDRQDTTARASYGSGGAGTTNGTILGLRRTQFLILVVAVIVAMMLSTLAGGLLGARFAAKQTAAMESALAATGLTINPTDKLGTTEAVAEKVLASVVGITTTVTEEGQNFFGWSTGPQERGGVGTGMIIDKSGYILTNSHVVLDGTYDVIAVLLSDGATVEGKVLWNDSDLDLAIVKIDPKGLSLKPVELADSSKLRLGQYVAAIGNPLGLDFNSSITQGVISGLDRSITASDGSRESRMEGLIQVDAAINSGNSGGPLLNSEGQVIGVNTAKAQAEGMGFAIPINTAKPIIESVIKDGSFERVYLGISAMDAATVAEQYPSLNLPSDVKGAMITAVSPGGPAETAGLVVKDIITKVGDKDIGTSAALIKCLLDYKANDTATITYLRDGKERTVKVKLASQSDAYAQEQQEVPGNMPQQPGSNGNGGYGYDPFANPFAQ
ncbi:MAG: S1C family serine protease [Clostridiales Family XIII bacterium]|jgi:S1-C subfamily serine protease|nr:S1C family serine protease [Clostridiales Family XIII bacterium]